MNTTYPLTNNKESKRYEFQIDQQFAFVEYIHVTTKNKIFLTHTEVPKALEGQGIGSALIKAVLEDVEIRNLILVPLCPFVAAYIKRHPEWKKLVLKGINIKGEPKPAANLKIKEMVKEYTNGELTVVWKPHKCQHAGICVKMLPEVYRPKEKPWIEATNASMEKLKAQISQCPSGALSYYMNSGTDD